MADPHRSLTFRRELLRLRELVAERYIADAPDPRLHAELKHALLTLTPESYAQVRHLSGLPEWCRRTRVSAP